MSCTLPITKRNPLNADNYVVSFCSWQTGLLLYVKESINYHQRWSNLGGVTHCVNNSTIHISTIFQGVHWYHTLIVASFWVRVEKTGYFRLI